VENCGSISFLCGLGQNNRNNRIKYTGLFSVENIAGDLWNLGDNNQFFELIIQQQNASGLTQQNGLNIGLDTLQKFLITHRLRVNSTSIQFWTTTFPADIYKNLYVNVYHSGIGSFEIKTIAFDSLTNSVMRNRDGAFALVYVTNYSQFWIQRSFNFYLNYNAPAEAPPFFPIIVSFNYDRIDTYANPNGIYTTECSKIPFDKILNINT